MFFFYRAARTVLRPRHRCGRSRRGRSRQGAPHRELDAHNRSLRAFGWLVALLGLLIMHAAPDGNGVTAGGAAVIVGFIAVAAAYLSPGRPGDSPPDYRHSWWAPKPPPEPPRPQAYYSNRR